MEEQSTERAFLARVREESERERAARKSPTRNPRYLRKISLLAGWMLAIVGIIIAGLFLFAMESAHQSFSPLAESGIVSVVQDDGFSEYFKQLSLDWLPMFFKVYSIRYLILIIEIALFGGLATVFFLLSRPNKKVSEA